VLGLSGRPGEEYGQISKDWSCDRVEMRLEGGTID